MPGPLPSRRCLLRGGDGGNRRGGAGHPFQMTEETQHLKPVELAKALRVSPAVISRWTKAGTITPAINEGKVIRFDLEAVKAELKSRATK